MCNLQHDLVQTRFYWIKVHIIITFSHKPLQVKEETKAAPKSVSVSAVQNITTYLQEANFTGCTGASTVSILVHSVMLYITSFFHFT